MVCGPILDPGQRARQRLQLQRAVVSEVLRRHLHQIRHLFKHASKPMPPCTTRQFWMHACSHQGFSGDDDGSCDSEASSGAAGMWLFIQSFIQGKWSRAGLEERTGLSLMIPRTVFCAETDLPMDPKSLLDIHKHKAVTQTSSWCFPKQDPTSLGRPPRTGRRRRVAWAPWGRPCR